MEVLQEERNYPLNWKKQYNQAIKEPLAEALSKNELTIANNLLKAIQQWLEFYQEREDKDTIFKDVIQTLEEAKKDTESQIDDAQRKILLEQLKNTEKENEVLREQLNAANQKNTGLEEELTNQARIEQALRETKERLDEVVKQSGQLRNEKQELIEQVDELMEENLKLMGESEGDE